MRSFSPCRLRCETDGFLWGKSLYWGTNTYDFCDVKTSEKTPENTVKSAHFNVWKPQRWREPSAKFTRELSKRVVCRWETSCFWSFILPLRKNLYNILCHLEVCFWVCICKEISLSGDAFLLCFHLAMWQKWLRLSWETHLFALFLNSVNINVKEARIFFFFC